MTVKYIKVTKCEECPYIAKSSIDIHTITSGRPFCDRLSIYGQSMKDYTRARIASAIDDSNTIPDWCPLPDGKKNLAGSCYKAKL